MRGEESGSRRRRRAAWAWGNLLRQFKMAGREIFIGAT